MAKCANCQTLDIIIHDTKINETQVHQCHTVSYRTSVTVAVTQSVTETCNVNVKKTHHPAGKVSAAAHSIVSFSYLDNVGGDGMQGPQTV